MDASKALSFDETLLDPLLNPNKGSGASENR
jgi:hypothetical protein